MCWGGAGKNRAVQSLIQIPESSGAELDFYTSPSAVTALSH